MKTHPQNNDPPQRCGTADPLRAGRSGFTLMEMLLVLVIIGAVTAVGFNVSLFMSDPLDSGAKMLVRQVSAARNRAMLLRKPVALLLTEHGATVEGENTETLTDGVQVVSVNGLPPDSTTSKLIFHPFGVVKESVIHLVHVSPQGGVRQRSVYVPGVGTSQILNGHLDMDHIMKELL